jgi:hypothetical protein
VAGQSGAGKSTTLAALIARGCAMLFDDVTALALTTGGQVEVMPGTAQLYLSEAAVSGLGFEVSPQPGPPWRMKSALATDERCHVRAGVGPR